MHERITDETVIAATTSNEASLILTNMKILHYVSIIVSKANSINNKITEEL
jgi:hypothetical protein